MRILILVQLFFHISSTHGSICSGAAASPNWYGTQGYPPYFTNADSENCPQKYSLSRCEQSAVMMDGTANFSVDESGKEVCTPNVNCFSTKQNCNDTLICSDLIQLKDELLEGGHNFVCRHEKTSWDQYTGEVKNCHLNTNCLDSVVKETQRQLQPLGWQSGSNFAKSFREMGIPVAKTYSSPFTRCAEHAQLFSDEPNEELIGLMYMSPWQEILKLNNITEKIQLNALKWQAYNLRDLAGKKPPAGKNNVIVTHGFNIKLSFGTAVDEGYCMVLKPEDNEPSLAQSIGSLTVSNRVFHFSNESYPVDAIARMSPEAAVAMQTCSDVQAEQITQSIADVYASADTNHDMKITKEEFAISHGPLNNTDDAFDFVLSATIQPELLGKPKDESPSIELGQFFHINWGWREYLKTGGDIAYPWRSILENTIGKLENTSPESRVTNFKRANSILSKLMVALRDVVKYPSKAEMEDKLINCNTDFATSKYLSDCAAKVFLGKSGGSSYIPIGPADGGAAALNDESIFGTKLAYPSNWKPGADFYISRLLKVANCLVTENFVSLSDTLVSMGCARVPTATVPPTEKPISSLTTLPTVAPTTSPTQSTCAVEWQKSKQCGSFRGKEECCDGLVCHKYVLWKCVKEENRQCSGPGMLSKKCGSFWWRASPECCSGLVCDYDTHKCVSPDDRYRNPIETSSTSDIPTSSPTLPFNYSVAY